MIPERITDEVYNALRWERKEVTDLDSEMQGYTVLGASACVSFYREDKPNSPTMDACNIYLGKAGEDVIKIICLDADFVYQTEKEQRNASPIELYVTYA